MSMNKLTAKVTEAVRLDREIAVLTERLKEIKSELVKAADSDLMEKTVTDGGGWSVELQGSNGCIARVTQPGAKLKSSLNANTTAWKTISEIPGASRLFIPEVKYVPVVKFREELIERVMTGEAKKILKLMTANSSPTVSFETKDAA